MDEKEKDLEQNKRDPGKDLTTNQGVKISDNQNSLKAGSRGPTLMEDFFLREKMTHFDHERIPERVVHARGSAAHGYFETYEGISELTKAGFLQKAGTKVPVFTRFSTVVGFRGSSDTVRDVRGFATKFYTDEGIFDLVGNNMPVFFIQDAIKFPDLVHAIKPEPHNEVPQASAAHDTFWDFISLMPESMHMIMWVISDRAIPRSYSMMEGFGVHTFRLVNAEGKSRFVKFHWKPKNGIHSLVWDEAQKLAGKDPDFNRKDLWQLIEDGNYPEFELGIQVIEEEAEFNMDFDILDATKIWPEEDVPVQIIGKMVLNKNPDNFFAETEQVAFHPGHVVPGIDFSNDPLLQGRLFSYTDTQLLRLGGPNFAEIPINRPTCPVHNNQRDGFSRQAIDKGRVSYEPNSLGNGCPMQNPANMGGFESYQERVEGHKIRERSDSFKDHYSQAQLFWNSMTPPEKEHMIEAFHFELGKVDTIEIREKMVDHLNHINHDLATAVAGGIGVAAPQQSKVTPYDKISDALSMEKGKSASIKGRKVAIIIGDGYDHEAMLMIKMALTEAGAKVDIISKLLGLIKSTGEDSIKADKHHIAAGSIMYDAIYVPGGSHINNLQKQGDAMHFIKEAYKHCKPIGLTGEATKLVEAAGLKTVKISENDQVTSSKGIVTMGADSKFDRFLDEFKTAILKHRHWDREDKEMISA